MPYHLKVFFGCNLRMHNIFHLPWLVFCTICSCWIVDILVLPTYWVWTTINHLHILLSTLLAYLISTGYCAINLLLISLTCHVISVLHCHVIYGFLLLSDKVVLCELAVKPMKGDALLFFSLHPDATTDTRSLHGSCPVIEGEKWSATKWIHVRSFDRLEKQPATDDCLDENINCPLWAKDGECEKNPVYMVGSETNPGFCRKSCKVCSPKSASS